MSIGLPDEKLRSEPVVVSQQGNQMDANWKGPSVSISVKPTTNAKIFEMKIWVMLTLISLGNFLCLYAQKGIVAYVDPLIGTDVRIVKGSTKTRKKNEVKWLL